MKHKKFWLLSLSAAVAAAITSTHDASACGGCFVQQTENTQVAGHRMILSVSLQATTLWDQITYSGEPESFAWVLPIKGTVDVGLSSDALFQVLDQQTQVTVASPSISCPNSCVFDGGAGGGGGGSMGGGVTVLKEEVVGPYETVQLSAADPAALTNWLTSHGYNIPADIQPVIDAYVGESFDFLALKLVPGQGINSMKPVRITAPGAGPTLPLRMVAAGTGAVTPIILWVFGDGRYEPANFPWFTIEPSEVVWDWDAASSNYSQLRQAKFQASDGFGWHIEDAETMYSWQIGDPLQYGEGFDSYADENGMNAQQNLDADLEDLYGNLGPNGFFVTRMMGELSRPALATDLQLGASLDQTEVNNYILAGTTVGTPPMCPPDPCAEGGSGGSGGNGGNGTGATGGNGTGGTGGNGTGGTGGDPIDGGKGSCDCGVAHGVPAREAWLGAGLLSALAAVLRRRRKAA
jgi:hypothetical protein